MPDIREQLSNIEVLRANLMQPSCVAKDALVKLGAGQAQSLDYNLPQNSTFTTYGHMPLNVHEDAFKEKKTAFNKVDTPNFFSKTAAELRLEFARSMQLNTDDMGLGLQVDALRKDLDTEAGQNLLSVSLKNAKDVEADNTPQVVLKDTCLNDKQLADLAEAGYRPFVVKKLNGIGSRLSYLKRPQIVFPRICIIEEYKTTSFLGRYGAGKTLQTLSLMPGEKTTITMRTYKNRSTSSSHSENILDSFSQSSVDELESLLESEKSVNKSIAASFVSSLATSISGAIKGIVDITSTRTTGLNITASRTSNTRALNHAMKKHVEQSNSSRNIEVNTTSSLTTTEGEEHTTIREIENINQSRVLNFVFRQLLQEYVSVTYLANIRIAYTNGLLESTRIVDIEDMDELLADVLVSEHIAEVKETILRKYRYVLNHKHQFVEFLHKMPDAEAIANIPNATDVEEIGEYYICNPKEEPCPIGGTDIPIPGVILQVQTHILQTDSVIADAMLGQGEALDCFNMRAQDAVAIGENLKNLEQMQKIEIIESLDEPHAKAELYKSVFPHCNDNPQTQIISNTTNQQQ